MEIAETRHGEVLILALTGRLDTETSGQLQEHWLKRIDEGDRWFVLDASDLAYVSSSGLRVLLIAAKRLKDPEGGIAVCGLAPRLQQVFEMTGFTTMFQVRPTREDAMQALKGAA
jgi:anti-sigma B factor antagonist